MRTSKAFKFILMSLMLCSASGAFASSASALTTNGPGNFTATAPASLLTINATGGAVGTQCTTVTAAGALRALTNASPPVQVGDATLSFGGCTVAGLPASVLCSQRVAIWATANPTAGVTPVQLRGAQCAIKPMSFPSCIINVVPTGGVGTTVASGSYSNSTGQLTVNATGQALTASWSSCPFITPSAGTASAKFTNTSGGSLVYTVTSLFKPVLT